MKKTYFSALALFASIIFTSCETENVSENQIDDSANRIAPLTGKLLRVVNDSDLQMDGEVYCFGADNNLTVNPNITITGKISVPANNDIKHNNFMHCSNSNYRIKEWAVSNGTNSPLKYTAEETNAAFGQLLTPGLSDYKFANWRYLKIKLSSATVPGLEPITMMVELPHYSQNNWEERVVNLTPYGLSQNLHITQGSYIDPNGNIVLTIDSEIMDLN